MGYRKVLSVFLLTSVMGWGQDTSGPSLPDAPQPEMVVETGHTVPLTYSPSKRQTVWNKKFVSAHAAYLGAIIYDVEVTHQGLSHHKCTEANGKDAMPSRGELYQNDLPVFAATLGLDWLMARYKIPYAPYVLPVTGTVVHARGGTKWFTEGCY